MDSNQQPSPLTNSPEVEVADFHGSAKSEMQIGGCQDASDLVQQLGGGLKYFSCSSLFGEDFLFDSYFSNGLKPPARQ